MAVVLPTKRDSHCGFFCPSAPLFLLSDEDSAIYNLVGLLHSVRRRRAAHSLPVAPLASFFFLFLFFSHGLFFPHAAVL